MRNCLKKGPILLICLALLAACSQSKSEAWNNTISVVKEVVKNKPVAANAEVFQFKYYKPSDYSIKKQSKNNIVFTEDETTYILFVNPNKEVGSQLHYERAKKEKTKQDLLKSFETESSFVYVYLKKLKEEHYKLVISEDNVVMKAKTTLDNLADRAEEMARVVHSIRMK